MVETPYYHISKVNRNGQIFLPRIPYAAKGAGLPEEGTIKRICCSPELDGCLKSSGSCKYHNAKIITNQDIFKNKYVYDAEITKETWICSPTLLKCVGAIQIITVSDAKNYKSKLSNGKFYHFYCNDYEFKWIDLSLIKQRYSKFYKKELPSVII